MAARPRRNTDNPLKVAVIGGGSFGTCLACVLARKGHQVVMLVRNEEQAKSITVDHKNSRYLTGYTLPENIVATTKAQEALGEAVFIILALPCQHLASFLKEHKDLIPTTTPLVSVSKGITTATHQFMNEVIPDALGRQQPAAFLSGPSFAKELMDGIPTAVVAAAATEELAKRVQKLFLSIDFRVYTSVDVVGVEVGGALKNVLAIAAGVVQGMGLGTNTMAALVTRGCGEMNKIAKIMGAKPETLAGLAGVGDLMLTCFGGLSRNLHVGKKLGEGMKLPEILAGMKEVAEGVYTAASARHLAEKYKINLPIMQAVSDMLDAKITPKEALSGLMSLEVGSEY